MQAKNCRERIIRLKEWRVNKALTVDQCIELCGDFPSDSTIRKVFAKGSEDKPSFRESTIAAIELAVMGRVYEPKIAIPVEDVIRAEKEYAGNYNAELEKKRLIEQQQKGLLNFCFVIIALFFLFNSVILIYDLAYKHIGFFTVDNVFVWVVELVFVFGLGVVSAVFIARSTIRKRKIQQLDRLRKSE